MSEDRLQLVSLSVLGGPLHGRRYNPEEVVGEVLIGSDSSCHLVLDLPTISPIHAKVWTDLDDCKLLDTSAPRGVYLNNDRVEGQVRLDEGDVFWLGSPQEPGSICIKCHFKPWLEVLPTAPVESVEAPTEAALEAAAFQEADAEEPSPMLEGGAGADEGLEPTPAQAGPEESLPEESLAAGHVAEEAIVDEPAAAEAPAEERAEERVEEPALDEEAAPARASASEPEAPASEPAADVAAPDEDDPFFVGEAAGSVPPVAPSRVAEPEAREDPSHPVGQESVEEVIFETAPPEPPAEHVPVAMSDDWAITETPAEPEPAPAPTVDEFFVADEPKPAAPFEPAFIEPEPDTGPVFEPMSATPFLDLPPLEAPEAPAPVAPPPRAPSPSPRPAPPATPAATPAGTLAAPAGDALAPEAMPAAAAAPTADTPAASEGPAAPAAPKPARPRPQPGAARRPSAAAAPARRPGPPRAAARGASGTPSWVRPAGLAGAGLLVVAALGFGAMKLLGGSVRLDSVEPKRVRVGQRATLSGAGFGSDPAAQTVLFGDREARVLQASPTRLEVEVPETSVATGVEGRVPVVVRAKGRSSSAVEVAVFLGPRLHGISPGAAMPGEEVMLAGAGWGVGATVRFGSAPAQTLEVQPTQIRAIVPETGGGPGTEADVVVTVAGVDSNPAPFILGHLPVLSALNPPSAVPGDVVSVSGRGFDASAARNDVRVGGVPALVIAASADSLQLVVPRLGPGEGTRTVELRVPGSSNVGQAELQLKALPDPVDFRFIAEPFTPSAGRSHALLATGLGPAFVLAASGGRSAAERAALAAERLNAAAQPLRTTLGLTLEARGLDSSPTLGLVGQPEPLVEISEEDAAAYNEDWTGLRGRGGPVTRARLARWWEALGRDIVLITVRGQAPQNAAALAPEGRVLGQLFESAQRAGAGGVSRQLVEDARPPLKDGLRLLALRVPPTVTGPAAGGVASAPKTATPSAAATPTASALQLEGSWTGSQVEQGQRQYLSVSIRGSGGSVAFEGGITFTVPMLSVEKPRRDQAHFSVQIRGGIRHYWGQWDGETLKGNVSTDEAAKNVVATFELRKR
jgi:FHA domain/IPT/TIG domain